MYPYMYWACNPNQWIKNHNIQFTKIAPSFTLFSAYYFGLHFSSLTPMGLPLRLGEALCIFYSCYGFCKFGPSCKFDHLIDISKYLFIIIRNCCIKFVIKRTWWCWQRPGNFHSGRVERCLLVMITLTRINEDTSLLLFTVFWG